MLGSRTRANSLCMDSALRLDFVGFDGIMVTDCCTGDGCGVEGGVLTDGGSFR